MFAVFKGSFLLGRSLLKNNPNLLMTMRSFSGRQSFLLPLITASFSIASCTANSDNNSENVSLVSAGASLSAPLYQRLPSVYSQKTPLAISLLVAVQEYNSLLKGQ